MQILLSTAAKTACICKFRHFPVFCKVRFLFFIGLGILEKKLRGKKSNMSLVEEKWQTTRPTLRERAKFLLNNDLFSDVQFVVRKSESESEQVIPAHKFVLSIGSPVFEAMFYGVLAETRDSIELPDCEYESLLELFRYMYSDDVNLSGSNVMGVLYLAKKYVVPSLAEKCSEYLKEHLDPSNVFTVLQTAQKYEEKDLVDRCWKVIDEQTGEAMKSGGFATIERSLLESIVERETLTIEEVELFKGVLQWATRELERRGVVADGCEIRNVIGEQIVKAIRFPTMKLKEFAAFVVDSEVLTYTEVADVIKYFGLVQDSSLFFSTIQRSSGLCNKLKRCSRFDHVLFGWSNGRPEIGFLVDQDIQFHGVSLFGSEGNSYVVTLTLAESSTVLSSTKGTFLSVPNVLGLHNVFVFDVLFKTPIVLRKNIAYSIKAEIKGPKSWCGTQGCNTPLCSGVTFTLRNMSPGKSSTGTTQGQFHEFIFTLI